jgi:cyclopropane fatty-acyl-phospholipid synthase-like methyltransferase
MYDSYLSLHLNKEPSSAEARGDFKEELACNYSLYFDQNTSVLEIGPGHGELLELLHESGLTDIHAVDISPEAVEKCNSIVPGSTLLVENTIRYLRNLDKKFDRLFMLHVLEHIAKPNTIPLLSAVRASLCKQGLLVVEVPNMANPIVGSYFRYADFTHESGFTEDSLEHVLLLAGFSSVEIHPFWETMTSTQRMAQFVLAQLMRFAFRSYKRREPIVSPAIFAVARK